MRKHPPAHVRRPDTARMPPSPPTRRQDRGHGLGGGPDVLPFKCCGRIRGVHEDTVHMKIGTIVARNYLAMARVLAESVRRLPEPVEFAVLLLDDEHHEVDDSGESFEILRPADLDIEPREFHHMATIYDVLELADRAEAVAPAAAARERRCRLLPRSRHRGVRVARSDRDAGPPALDRAHAAHHDARCRVTAWSRARRRSGWRESSISDSSPCRVTPARSSRGGRNGCAASAGSRSKHGLFVDQRWIDFVPSYFDHTVAHRRGLQRRVLESLRPRAEARRRRLRGQRPAACASSTTAASTRSGRTC